MRCTEFGGAGCTAYIAHVYEMYLILGRVHCVYILSTGDTAYGYEIHWIWGGPGALHTTYGEEMH
jgi:hypothetical protein